MNSKRIRKKQSPPVNALPHQVAWLVGISMNVTPLISWPRPSHRRVDYLLSVTCQSRDSANSSIWHLVRSFDDFRFFRKRLVVALRRGHFCHAECPWLYTFLKSYYPKSQLLGSSLARVMDRRRKTLTRCLATIQSFLMNKANHVCSLVMQGVARELLEFVVGERHDFEQDCHDKAPAWLRLLLQRWREGDLHLENSTSPDNTPQKDSAIERERCTLCDEPLVFQRERQAIVDEDQWYYFAAAEPFSTLSCGHYFHDECLIHKLNEVMRCPSCGQNE